MEGYLNCATCVGRDLSEVRWKSCHMHPQKTSVSLHPHILQSFQMFLNLYFPFAFPSNVPSSSNSQNMFESLISPKRVSSWPGGRTSCLKRED